MLITKESDYGVRIIRVLADGSMRTVGEICEIENIPNQYAYKILKNLERKGFLRSKRGRVGGYSLIKPLDSITLFDVFDATNDNLHVNECLKDGKDCRRNTKEHACMFHTELRRVQKILTEELKRKTMVEIL